MDTKQPSDAWKVSFLHQLGDQPDSRESLYELLEEVRQLRETTDPTPGLCLLLAEFLTQHRGDLGRYRYELAAVVGLIGQVNALKESFECFNTNADYINQYELAVKEGGQGHE